MERSYNFARRIWMDGQWKFLQFLRYLCEWDVNFPTNCCCRDMLIVGCLKQVAANSSNDVCTPTGNSVECNYEINRFDWTLAAVLEMVHWLIVGGKKKKMITRHWTDRHALHACSLILFSVAMTPLPSSPSLFLHSIVVRRTLKLNVCFGISFRHPPSVENCKNWQYLRHPAKRRTLLVSESHQITNSELNKHV